MYLPAQDMVYQRVFKPFLPGTSLPPIIDLIHNVSLVLVNTHPIFQYPRPVVPNMVQGMSYSPSLQNSNAMKFTQRVALVHYKRTGCSHARANNIIWDCIRTRVWIAIGQLLYINEPFPYLVGGLHINSSSETIAQEIFDYVEAAPEGVIYISLGSQVKSHDLPIEQISALVKVFETYVGKMRIIWKWENATLIDHPYNVIVGPTVPQQALLGGF